MVRLPIELSVDNQKLNCNLYSPSKPKMAGALFLHGWTGQPNERAGQKLADNGYHALTFSMRGHNGSEGDIKKVTAEDSLNDAMVAYDFLAGGLPPNSPIFVIGNSYGSYIAVLLSERRNVQGLSLRAPAAYPDELFGLPKWGRGHDDPAVDSWRKQRRSYSDNKAFKLLHDFKGKIQILESEKDEVVPHQTVDNYVKAVSNTQQVSYELLKDWPHSMGDNLKRNQEFQNVLLDWIEK